jgi:hypothetical protein
MLERIWIWTKSNIQTSEPQISKSVLMLMPKVALPVFPVRHPFYMFVDDFVQIKLLDVIII